MEKITSRSSKVYLRWLDGIEKKAVSNIESCLSEAAAPKSSIASGRAGKKRK